MFERRQHSLDVLNHLSYSDKTQLYLLNEKCRRNGWFITNIENLQVDLPPLDLLFLAELFVVEVLVMLASAERMFLGEGLLADLGGVVEVGGGRHNRAERLSLNGLTTSPC